MTSEFLKRDLERSSTGKFVLLSGKDVDDASRLMRLLSEPLDLNGGKPQSHLSCCSD